MNWFAPGLLLLLQLPTLAWAEIYTIKKGDCLTWITQKHLGPPIYGSNGNLNKVIKANPQIKNPDLIFPGQSLNLETPAKLEAPTMSDANEDSVEATQTEASNTSDSHQSVEIAQTPFSWEHENYYYVAPSVFFTRLDITDLNTESKATLLSDVNYQFKVGAAQRWRPMFETFVDVGLSHLSFANNTSGSSQITGGNFNLLLFGVGANYFFTEKITFIGKITYNQDIFARGLDTNKVTLESVYVPQISIASRIKFTQWHQYDVNGEISVTDNAQISTQHYQVKSSLGYGLKLLMDPLESKKDLQYGAFYQRRDHDTSIFSGTRQDAGLFLTYFWGNHRAY